ncbi:MAG: hypothetical protein JNJ89_00530 [Rubrivivax sp.]|nr:hypothetical protein [Rubrivivax sp.]
MSKLLSTLNTGIASATDDLHRAELQAKKAGYLARVGRFEEAQQIIAQLRSAYGDGRSPSVSVWTMLAEGLLHTYRDMADEGADRIMRANVLAGAMRDRPLIAATATWRAHLQSERSEFKGMARSVDDAFANCTPEDHELLARLYMTIGNARMSVGSRTAANELYMFARHHALECGDQATIDALIYNKAAFALAWMRARSCYGELDQDLIRQIRVEIASAKTYQQLAEVGALANFVFLWEARLYLLSGEYDRAIPALESIQYMEPFARYNYHASLVRLEVAYCQIRTTQGIVDREAVRAAVDTDFSGLHDDDKLVATWLKREVVAAMPDLGDLSAASRRLEAAQAEFDASCLTLRNILDGLAPQPHIKRPPVAMPKPQS